MNDDQFAKISDTVHKVMPSVFDAYIDAGRGPSEDVVLALIDVVGGSPNEFRKWFAKYASSKGSNLFFAHYPAFGEPGCEFDPPRK